MLKLTKKTDYGLNFLVNLAKTDSKTPVTLTKIAKVSRLPRPFLAKLASSLTKARIIKSKEGVNGGYILAKKAAEISLAEVMTVLESQRRDDTVNCKNCSCQFCTKRDVVRPLEEEIEKTLRGKTLADLIIKPHFALRLHSGLREVKEVS